MKSPEDLLSRLRQAGRVLITSHANPDGDAIGAAARPGAPGAHAWARAPRSGTAIRCRRSTARCRRPTASTSARSRRAATPTTTTPWSCSSARASIAPASKAQLAGMMPIAQHRSSPRQPALRRRQLGRRVGPGRGRDGAAPRQRPQARDRPRHRRLPLPRAGVGHRRLPLTPTPRRARSRPRRSWSRAAPRPSAPRSGSTRAARRRCCGCWARCWRRSRSRATAGSPPRCSRPRCTSAPAPPTATPRGWSTTRARSTASPRWRCCAC